jgi:hypothetical protein
MSQLTTMLRSVGLLRPKMSAALRPDIRDHFLHIRKTGGTTFKAVLAAHLRIHPTAPVHAHDHTMTLERARAVLPYGRLAFFVRDPVERFISGFNSRLRMGRPRYNNPWSPEEAIAFRLFPTPNDLAEALSSGNADRHASAVRAMHGIIHVRSSLASFLVSVEFLNEMADRICFIGDMRNFDADLAVLRTMFGIDPRVPTPTDPRNTHRMPAQMSRHLSDLGLNNIRQWYAADFPIYEHCLNMRETLLRASSLQATPNPKPASERKSA